MENTTGKVELDRQVAAAMEERCVLINVAINRMQSAVARGDLERFRNLAEEAGESNWTNRRALLDAGAWNSIHGDKPMPPDDDDLLDTDALDLGELRGMMDGHILPKHEREE